MDISSFREVIIQEFMKWEKEGVNDTESYKKRLHHFRTVFEQYVFNILIKRYSEYLADFWKEYIPHKQADNAFVIIERRCHPNFWFVLRNIAWANPNMSVYIICSEENEMFIRSLLGNKVSQFNILTLFNGSPDREQAIREYNNLLTDYRFYEQIKAKYMLTIQMDVFIRRKLTDDIFIGDYWGAPWGWKEIMPGGGGATIRHVQRLYDLCKKYRPTPLDNDNYIGSEDSWISDKIIELGWNYPDIEFRKKAIMESIPTANPYIVHQFWTFFDSFKFNLHSEVFAKYLHCILTFVI